jgi:hypothetical protein
LSSPAIPADPSQKELKEEGAWAEEGAGISRPGYPIIARMRNTLVVGYEELGNLCSLHWL